MSEYDLFMVAVMDGDLDDMKIYYKEEYLNMADIFGFGAIHSLVTYNYVEPLKWLLEKKCDIELSIEKYKWRPIHFAASGGHKEIIKLLMNNGCEIDCRTSNNESPLVIARNNIQLPLVNDISNETVSNDCDDYNTENVTNDNKKIGLLMGLTCPSDCDHRFCLSALTSMTFIFDEIIGYSEKAMVYKLNDYRNSQKEFAMKFFSLNSYCRSLNYIEQNINKYRRLLRHERIIYIFGSITKSKNIHIFMEFMTEGTIADKIEKTGLENTKQILKYSKQILEALEYLHGNKIIHRNVNPLNVLLDKDDNCKLAGFSESRLMKTEKINEGLLFRMKNCNCYRYMAPEIINDEEYDFSCDLWSVGATVMNMLTGKLPYFGKEYSDVISDINNLKKNPFKKNLLKKPISIQMQTFINKMLDPDPSQRSNASSLLCHDIFNMVPKYSSLISSSLMNDLLVSDERINRQDCVDLIQEALDNKEIIQSLHLTCGPDCDHEFCFTSLKSKNLKNCFLIGNGKFGKVFKVINLKSNDQFAMKVTEINVIEEENNRQEARRFEENINNYRYHIKHKSIIKYYGAITFGNKIFIFMEYMDEGSLKNQITKNGYLKEKTISNYCKQILEGLQFLHDKTIIHRDIKPDNILINSRGYLKLVDFGCSRFKMHLSVKSMSTDIGGTPNYMAPETVLDEGHDYSADIWSLGATVVEMVSGRPPFYKISDPITVIYFLGINRIIEYEPCEPMSPEMTEFIDNTLKSIPEDRPTAKSLLYYEFILSN